MNNKIIKYDFVKYLSFPLQSQYLALLKFLFLDETNIKLNEYSMNLRFCITLLL